MNVWLEKTCFCIVASLVERRDLACPFLCLCMHAVNLPIRLSCWCLALLKAEPTHGMPDLAEGWTYTWYVVSCLAVACSWVRAQTSPDGPIDCVNWDPWTSQDLCINAPFFLCIVCQYQVLEAHKLQLQRVRFCNGSYCSLPAAIGS
jgi:hypothetical protein